MHIDNENYFLEECEFLAEFLIEVEEKHHEIEYCINKLHTTSPADQQEIFNELFRTLHTIKGNAKYAKIEPMSQFLHHVESLISRLRSQELEYNEQLGEIILLCSDRALLMAQEVQKTQKLNILGLDKKIQSISDLAKAPPDRINDFIQRTFAAILGEHQELTEEESSIIVPDQAKLPSASDEEQALSDIEFFEELDAQAVRVYPFWTGKVSFITPLALGMNTMSGNAVDHLQLKAAIILHDVGMTLLPNVLVEKKGRFDDDEREQLQRHPELMANIVKRMVNWSDAAQMIAQHHVK